MSLCEVFVVSLLFWFCFFFFMCMFWIVCVGLWKRSTRATKKGGEKLRTRTTWRATRKKKDGKEKQLEEVSPLQSNPCKPTMVVKSCCHRHEFSIAMVCYLNHDFSIFFLNVFAIIYLFSFNYFSCRFVGFFNTGVLAFQCFFKCFFFFLFFLFFSLMFYFYFYIYF